LQCNQNVPLFKEAIILRDEAARLLGYLDHASFRIEDKMAKTPKTVNDFLDDLRVQLAPGGVKETEYLKEIKKEDLISPGLESTNDGNYYLWVTRFYNRMMVEKEFSIDGQKIAEYFPLQSTIEGMLAIFEELFGLQQPLDSVSLNSIELIPNGQHKREEEIPIWLDIHKRWQELFGRHLSLQ
jgi:metallopeptidase MepB